jgi:hypothetical protein
MDGCSYLTFDGNSLTNEATGSKDGTRKPLPVAKSNAPIGLSTGIERTTLDWKPSAVGYDPANTTLNVTISFIVIYRDRQQLVAKTKGR